MIKKCSILVIILGLFMSIGVSSVFAADTWVGKASLLTPRMSHDTVSLDGKIYVVGGTTTNSIVLNTVEKYDPNMDTWEKVANMNIGRYRPEVISYDGKLYVFGGSTSMNSATYTDQVEVYDPTINKWTNKTQMSSARSDVLAATVNQKIYVIGGVSSSGLSNTVEEYDPKLNTWITKASIPSPRQSAGLAVVDGKIYVIGGLSGGSNTTVQVYDPLTNTWASKKDMPIGKANFGISSINNKIYIIGGNINNSSPNTTDKVEVYDPSNDTWAYGANTLIPRNSASSTSLNGNIYLTGGYELTGTSYSLSNRNEILKLEVPKEFILTGTNNGISNNLNWSSLENITNYTVKRSLKAGGPYEALSKTNSTSYIDTNIQNNTDYYYIISATGDTGLVRDSNEIHLVSSVPTITGNALLTITMTNGIQKEYDLPMIEVNAFIKWYDNKEDGTGPAKFGIDMHDNNKGPFNKRIDYVIFKNILSFEVSEYTLK
ncbi:N-acetylneuraminic acid mutarotase [Paenibacillus shirakamiensis]|uniref:N-acetylneuraminic acid mutarotase n=1 Tax=Paenibacillus shirakamiensis TaxID=1265935 RepID=A0ABS4JDI0_9BACL|nr:kelch repeat-containing protein [Paenibacillus shirakamiensis]MBP1999773.1 N-acetylneuraminic acid mutarotase [Paenibacillus shirakamiensis]